LHLPSLMEPKLPPSTRQQHQRCNTPSPRQRPHPNRRHTVIMGTGRGRPTRGSGYGDEDGDDGHKKKGRGHKDRQEARRRRDKKQHQDDAWYAKFDDQKVPLRNRNIADGLGITLDRLSKLGVLASSKMWLARSTPRALTSLKGLQMSETMRWATSTTAFPSSVQCLITGRSE
jgi:hypothetical protein